ncbi:MAG TPA: hypothetical protein PKC72_15065 [Chitinophagaceae bacterium]|nr:hypothetical protein [Chitinophagaceae bacterium]
MKKKYHHFIFAAFLLFSCLANGQQTGDSALHKDKLQFKLGVFYNSNLNYYGRTDSLKSSAVFPIAELWFNQHLYLNAAPVFINNVIQKFEYAGSVATAGYRFGRDNKEAGNIYFVKPFYKINTDLVQSALKAQVAGTYSWLNKIINITAGADVKFSNKIDYGVTGGLDHIFKAEPGKGFVIVINPSAYINAGTQQFTKTYYKKSSFLLFPGVEQQVTEEVKGFNILSYEFSSLIIIAKGKFQFIINPSFVVPQNLIKVENRPDLSERGKNIFYATLGAKVIF